MPTTTLRVGAVQTVSENGRIEANLAHALPFVEEAAGRGARLILLPEFLPTGYIYTTAIWDAAASYPSRHLAAPCRRAGARAGAPRSS